MRALEEDWRHFSEIPKGGFRYTAMMKCLEIRITGVVQGVGFRPFVYTLATAMGLGGYVRNDARGVLIVVEGDGVEDFGVRLQRDLPPLARIDTLEVRETAPEGLSTFEIRASDAAAHKSVAVSADMAVCDDCLREMRDPTDRRHGYYLINCTHCGPRYSIIRTVPYDRIHTSMADFTMCEACRNEYETPTDRHYHAQPISCDVCGPTLTYHDDAHRSRGEAALTQAIQALQKGQIIAVKGLGGFHILCDATDEAVVQRLRRAKGRPTKPFAVMFASMAAIRECTALSDGEAAMIESKEKPIVLVAKKPSTLAPSIAPGIDRLGAFLPYTPLHYRLFETLQFPLVATSANLSDAPILRDEEALVHALPFLGGILSHDRAIVNACDDAVVQMLDDRLLMLRRARGFAPYAIRLPSRVPQRILAVGAQQKNTIALAFDETIILSPHIGDLGSLEAFEYFERTVATFQRFYDFEPDLIVCDKHPGYATTQWALEQGRAVLQVQHHHAHLLAALFEWGQAGEVLGFAFDGTGYGDDGTIWGGEVIRAQGTGYARIAALRPFRLLGGDKASREPRRAALGILFEIFPLETVLALDTPPIHAFTAAEIRQLHTAWQRGINAPFTSSMGRLFDAVASLGGLCQQVSYEGESGLLVERAADETDPEPYAFTVQNGNIDWEPMIRAMLESPQKAAGRFLHTVVDIVITLAKQHDLPVVLTGGVFQNRTLLSKLIPRLEAEAIPFFLPSQFPVNDGGIALGQVWYGVNTAGSG